PGNVYVTSASGSVQRGADAVEPGGIVNVEAGFVQGYDAGAKPLTVAFEGGPSLTLEADPLNPCRTRLVVVGTANDDQIAFERTSAGSVRVSYGGIALGVHRPTGRLLALGGEGNDILTVS